MKFVALVSGGKDSICSIIECIQNNGHELVGCVHLGRPKTTTIEGEEEEESYMFQTAASEVVRTVVEECLQVPFILYERKGKSINTSLVYENNENDDNEEEDGNEQDTTEQQHDEVEDIYNALKLAQEQLPVNFQGVSSGAILSTYQRVRIENVCNRLNLISLSYLWRIAPQHILLQRMIHNYTIHAVLVRTACPPGLLPHKHLNHTIQELGSIPNYSLFYKLNQLYQFHICGEGGEYETLVLDCPIYKKRLVLDDVEIVYDDESDDTIGYLRILKCHSEDKVEQQEQQDENNKKVQQEQGASSSTTSTTTSSSESVPHIPSTTTMVSPSSNPESSSSSSTSAATTNVSKSNKVQKSSTSSTSITPIHRYMPHVQHGTGGLLHVSEIMASIAAGTNGIGGGGGGGGDIIATNDDEVNYAVQEILEIFQILNNVLQTYNATSKDVLMVHLYLSEISHFGTINQYYKEFFGTTLPPSRSCVGIGKHLLPGGRRVALDCIIQCGSSSYMRNEINNNNNDSDNDKDLTNPYANAAVANRTSKLRDVLHVQSLSYWAPVCVGPYSQVNTLRNGIHFLAGQIGLYPPTMKLVDGGYANQLQQCWKNIASVLDALGGSTVSTSSNDGTTTRRSGGSTLRHLLSGLVYVADHVYRQQGTIIKEIENICRSQIRENAGVVPGQIDSTRIVDEELFDGYEDEETWREEECNSKNKKMNANGVVDINAEDDSICPLLVVSIPEMPVGAIIEVEVIAATSAAASCLEWNESFVSSMVTKSSQQSYSSVSPRLGWDTGHDFSPNTKVGPASTVEGGDLKIDGTVRLIGKGCAAAVVVTASYQNTSSNVTSGPSQPVVDTDTVLREMLATVDKVLAAGRSGLDTSSTLNMRLYYVATVASPNDSEGGGGVSTVAINDGIQLRSSLQSAIASWRNDSKSCLPATTVVPVQGMHLIPSKPLSSTTNSTTSPGWSTLLAIQALVVDPVHLETEIWINHGRDTS